MHIHLNYQSLVLKAFGTCHVGAFHTGALLEVEDPDVHGPLVALGRRALHRVVLVNADTIATLTLVFV